MKTLSQYDTPIVGTETYSGTTYEVAIRPHAVNGRLTGKWVIDSRRQGSGNEWVRRHMHSHFSTYEAAAALYGRDMARRASRPDFSFEIADPDARAAYDEMLANRERTDRARLEEARTEQEESAGIAERRARIDAEAKAAKWKRLTITLEHPPQDVTGPAIGGLLVHRCVPHRDGRYTITHVASTKGVVSGAFSFATVRVIAYRLSRIHDWTLPEGELMKSASKLKLFVDLLKEDPYAEITE